MMVLLGSTSIARYFSLARGKFLSLSSLGLPLAESFMPILTFGLISTLGWTVSWQILAASILLIFIPLTIVLVSSTSALQQVPEANGEKDTASVPT